MTHQCRFRAFDLTVEHGAIYEEEDCVVIAWAEKPDPYKFTMYLKQEILTAIK